jgi:hypothetical protein
LTALRRAAIGLLLLIAAALLAGGCAERAAVTPVSVTVATPTPPLSEKELAEQSVADAEHQIKKVDGVIAWFKGNASTRDDMQLPKIITKREVALSYLLTANDEIANGNYAYARVKAQEADSKANESYNDALKRQQDILHLGATPCGKLRIPPDAGILLILMCILPILLAFLLKSLVTTFSLPRILSLPEGFRSGILFAILAGLLTGYPLLLAGAGITRNPSLITLAVGGTYLWAALMIVLIILSVLVIGIISVMMIRSRIKNGHQESGPSGTVQTSFLEKITIVVKIELMIILILIMTGMVWSGFVISNALHYPIMCF